MRDVPKRKYAKARQGKIRCHQALTLPPLNSCPHCHTVKLSHRVCPTCGYYAGKEAIPPKEPKKKTG